MSNLAPTFELLAADGPDDAYRSQLMQFGRLVGSWDLEASFFDEDGTEERMSAEWHWDWILGGRAIQDVMVFPARSSSLPEGSSYRYGTSIRLYDAMGELWRVVWIAPESGTVFKLTGVFSEDEAVVLNGDPNDGEPTKWIFSQVTDDSFLWEGFVQDDPSSEWRLIQRMTARRVNS